MTLENFRIQHSIIVEHYQYIEHHLEGIYALICGNSFPSGLKTVEKSNMAQLLSEISKIETETNLSILSDSDYETLEHIRVRRNYWCHECYVNIVFDRKTGTPKKTYVDLLIKDIQEAEEARESLFKKKMELWPYR